jgi:protein TonB
VWGTASPGIGSPWLGEGKPKLYPKTPPAAYLLRIAASRLEQSGNPPASRSNRVTGYARNIHLSPVSIPLPARRTDMLENSLIESQDRRKTRKPLTVVVSAVAHLVAIVLLVLIPLLQTQALTIPPADMSMWAPRIETPRRVEVFSVQLRVHRHTEPAANMLTAPESIPTKIVYVDDPVSPPSGFAPSTGNNSTGPLIRDLINRQPEAAALPPLPPSPPPPPPPLAVKVEPYRVSHMEQADLVHRVNPAYPPLARQARVQGVVVLEAVINKEGAIESLRVVTGHPLLNQAAVDAVKQWRYRPLMLNGEPTEVITTVTVTFTLQ